MNRNARSIILFLIIPHIKKKMKTTNIYIFNLFLFFYYREYKTIIENNFEISLIRLSFLW